jgi:hypothetical protein
MTPPLGKMPSVDNNSMQLESNIITPMINRNSSITKTGWSGDKASMTGSSIASLMDVSSYMMKTEGEDDKIEETENLERLEKAVTAEQSHEHTGGTKPDKDDQYEQDNKKQHFAESNSTLITGTIRQMRALNNQQKSCLFLSERTKHYEFSQYNRILLVIPSVQSDNKESGIVHI